MPIEKTKKLRVVQAYKYKESYVTEIVKLADQGLFMIQIAAAWSVSRRTFYNWADTYPDFAQAYDVARTKQLAWLINSMQKGLHDRNYNSRCAELLLRFGVGAYNVKPLKADLSNAREVREAVNEVFEFPDYTVDQRLKLVQAIETAVRALETADAIRRLETLEEHVKKTNKTRVTLRCV